MGCMSLNGENTRNPLTEPALCRCQQPDKQTGHCILYDGHEGPHQTFVAEWNDGAPNSRRRQPPPASRQYFRTYATH
jgi:hypothetical protein